MNMIDCLKYPGTRLTEVGCAKYAIANPEKCAGCQRNSNEKPVTGVCIKCNRPGRKIIAKGQCKSCYNAKYSPRQNARQKEVRAAKSSQVVIHITVSPADAGALLQFITGLKTLTGGAA